MIVRLLVICSLAGLVLTAHVGRSGLQRSRSNRQVANQLDEVLYVPNGEGLKLLAFGYDRMLAHVIWFRSISYFGKHYASDRNYQWLEHLCDIATRLNPEAKHAYLFCSTMLSWEAGRPEGSLWVLRRAERQFPDDWYIPYLLGFTRMHFLKDEAGALEDFIRSSKLPSAHQLVKRLAAKKLIELQDPDSAVEFLSQMLHREQEAHARASLEERLKQALLERDLRRLDRAIRAFREREGRDPTAIEELVTAGVVAELPADPYGGEYELRNNPLRAGTESERHLVTKRPRHATENAR
jgi:tetratricopeptide (TPR) repeat protein